MMEKKDIRIQLFYRLFYVILLVCSGILGVGKWISIERVVIWQVVIAVLFAVVLCSFSFMNIRGRILCVVAFMGCGIITFLLVSRDKMALFWTSYVNWIVNGCSGDAEWSIWFGCVQAVYVAVGCYVFWLLAERFDILKRVLAAVIGVVLILCLLRKETMNHIGVSCMLWYLFLIFIEVIQGNWHKVRKHDRKSYMIWLMPFCAVYFLLLCILPAPEKPFDWAFAKNAYQQVRETVIACYRNLTRGDKEDFGLAVSGFSEDGALGAGFIDSNRVLLEIDGKESLVTNIYLTGKIYDTFDGREWRQEAVGDEKDRFLDTMETLYTVERYSDENTKDYIYNTKLDVTYRYLDTGYVFAPLKTWEIEGEDWASDGPNLVFGEKRGYGTEYTTTYYQMNVDHPAFYAMLEVPKEVDEELWNSLVRRYTRVDKHEYAAIDDLQAHREYIHNNYQKTVALSEQVRDYLDEITVGANTNIEKLRAIETELASYTYTKNPGKLPEQVVDENSYLEYFLLESKQGYCSYFASAFVLLARAEGLPARYVEGFCVPANEKKHMTVYSYMAHAWPEVYLDEVGWIPFEPTPGYEEVRYTPWELGSIVGTWENSVNSQDAEAGTALDDRNRMDETETFYQRKIIVLGSLGVLGGFFVIFLIDNLIKKRHYAQMSNREKFFVEIRKSLWVLGRFGMTRKDSETIQEFMIRVQHSFRCLYIYEEVLYGNAEVTEAMLQCVREERLEWMQWIKNHKRFEYPVMRLCLSCFGRWW